MVDIFHGEAYLAAIIKAHKFDIDFLAFGQEIRRVIDALWFDLRDMDKSIFLTKEIHKGAEVDNFDNFTLVNHADFRFGSQAVDPLHRRFDRRFVSRGDFDCAIIFDRDARACCVNDFANDFTARADDVTDFINRDFHRFDTRCKFTDFAAGFFEGLVHFAKDMKTASIGLLKRSCHNLFRDTCDFDVHLKRGNPFGCSGHFKVHIAKVIFVPKDIRENRCVLTFFDKAHGNTRNWTL